jgi:hypothetical protein
VEDECHVLVVLTNKYLSHIQISGSNDVLFTVMECRSSQYKIWNSEADVPHVADMPLQDLQRLLME